MPKAVIAYLLVGCVVIGVALKKGGDWCPNDQITMQEIFFAVLVWPVPFVAACFSG